MVVTILSSTVISTIIGAVLTFWFNRKMKLLETRIEARMPARKQLFTDKYSSYLHLSHLIGDCRYELKHVIERFDRNENPVEIATLHQENLIKLVRIFEDAFGKCIVLIDEKLFDKLHIYKREIEHFIPYLSLASTPDNTSLQKIKNSINLVYGRVDKSFVEITAMIKERLGNDNE